MAYKLLIINHQHNNGEFVSEIWNNPLMPKPAKDKKPDLDAFDQFIAEMEKLAVENTSPENILFPSNSSTTDKIQVDIGQPLETQDPFAKHLGNIPTGHTHMFDNSHETNQQPIFLTMFDFYNSSAMVTEDGGIADKLGIKDSMVFEIANQMGMNVTESFDNRDIIKTGLSLLKLISKENIPSFDKKLLDHIRKLTNETKPENLMDEVVKYGQGIILPDGIESNDLYHIIMASRANESNFNLIFSNLKKVL